MVESLLSLAMVESFVIYGDVLHLFGKTKPNKKAQPLQAAALFYSC